MLDDTCTQIVRPAITQLPGYATSKQDCYTDQSIIDERSKRLGCQADSPSSDFWFATKICSARRTEWPTVSQRHGIVSE
jgi:hypothetical protein